MARWQPMTIVGGAYADDNKPWSVQDTVNYIPVPAEKGGTRSREILRSAPGLVPIVDLGTNAPIRGMRNVEGKLLVISAQTLFQVNTDGSYTELGTIPGVKRCSLSHNQITGGNEVAISNGQAGYVYNTKTGALAQITDEGFPGAICFDFVDGYILGIEPARRFAFTSDLAAATSYNTLDQYEAEGSPDLLVGQAVTHREWWLMGERTIEPFVNTGAATGTFQRAQGTVIEVGLAATHAVAVMDNSVFWLGSDGIVYRANGYTPQRISTHAIEQAISSCNIAQAFAVTFEDNGHKVFYLTFPDGHTWGYDAATGEWHRRQSKSLSRWRINTLARWQNRWVAGDYANGRLYQVDWRTMSENGDEMERRRVTGVTHDNQNALIINGIELVVDTGYGAQEVTNPLIRPLSIAGDLGSGYEGEVISYQYTVLGGSAPVSVSVLSGALPAGLSISSTGLVSGTRTTAGSYSYVLRATDSVGNTVDLADSSNTNSTDITSFITATSHVGTNQTVYAADVAGGVIAVAYNNGLLSHSSDAGVSWSEQSGLCGGSGLAGVRYFNGRWYVHASSNATWMSAGSDFVFSSMANGPVPCDTSLTVANGKLFVGYGGAGNTILYEMVTAGSTWTAHDLGSNYGYAQSLLWTGTCYLLGTSSGRVFRSTDLSSWTQVQSLGSGTVVSQIAKLGSTIIAATLGGNWVRSTDDGVTWTAATNVPPIGDLCATPSMFVGGRNLAIYTSHDGVTWTNAYTSASGTSINGNGATSGALFAIPVNYNKCIVGTSS